MSDRTDVAAHTGSGVTRGGRVDLDRGGANACSHHNQRSLARGSEHLLPERRDVAPRPVRDRVRLRAGLQLVRRAGWDEPRLGRRGIPTGFLTDRPGAGCDRGRKPRYRRITIHIQQLLVDPLCRAAVVCAPPVLLQLLESLSTRASTAASQVPPASRGPTAPAGHATTRASRASDRPAARGTSAPGHQTTRKWQTTEQRQASGQESAAAPDTSGSTARLWSVGCRVRCAQALRDRCGRAPGP
jgi:hypothetical protein